MSKNGQLDIAKDNVLEQSPEVAKSSELVLSVINGQLERQSRLISSLYQRASILIGASGISTALLTKDDLPLVWLIPIALFVASIVLAVLSLMFKKAKQFDPATVFQRWENHDTERFERNVLKGLTDHYNSVKETILPRSRKLSAGMILFGSGWVVTFMIILIQAIEAL